jgi:molybdopterin converting factor small subunit
VFLVDGAQAGGRAAEAVPLAEGAVVEVLPPFAGG